MIFFEKIENIFKTKLTNPLFVVLGKCFIYFICFLILAISGFLMTSMESPYNYWGIAAKSLLILLAIVDIIFYIYCIYRRKNVLYLIFVPVIAVFIFIIQLIVKNPFLYETIKFLAAFGLIFFFLLLLKTLNIDILEYFYNIIIFLSITSLIFFIVVNFTNVDVPHVKISNIVVTTDTYYLVVDYNSTFIFGWSEFYVVKLFSFVFIRLQSIFWEPSIFGYFLSFSLYYLLFERKKKNKIHFIILSLCCFFTMSTTALSLFAALIYAYIIKKQKNKKNMIIAAIVGFIFVIAFVGLFFYLKKSSLSNMSKMRYFEISSQDIPGGEGSGGSQVITPGTPSHGEGQGVIGEVVEGYNGDESVFERIKDILRSLIIFKTSPIFGIGLYNDGIFLSTLEARNGCTNGLFVWLYNVGLVGFVPIFVPFVYLIIKRKEKIKYLTLLGLFVLNNMGSPLFRNDFNIVFVLYYWIEAFSSYVEREKVLFICPKYFGYETQISKEMFSNNLESYMVYENLEFCSLFYRFILVYFKKYKDRILFHYYKRKIANFDTKFDKVFVIRAESLTVDSIKWIKNRFSNAKYVMYQWDGIAFNENAIKIAPYFNKILTFDETDAEKLNWKYRPLFACEFSEDEIKSNDILFIGSLHSKRIDVLNKLFDIVKENNYSFKYVLYENPVRYFKWKYIRKEPCYQGLKDSKMSYVPMNLYKTYKLFKKSKVVVDFSRLEQTGLTIRTIESLMNNTKLITNNTNLKRFNIYNANNVAFYFDVDVTINKEFVDEKYVPLPKEIKNYYSLSTWLKEVLIED